MSVVEFVLISVFFCFATVVQVQGCTEEQQRMTRTCFGPHFMYNRSSEDLGFEQRISLVGEAGLSDPEYINRCRVMNDLANCLKMSNLTGCVTGPMFSTILAANYSSALSNVTVAKTLNCVNDSISIWDAVKCSAAGEGDDACVFNSTNTECSAIQNVTRCQLPKAKKTCGLLAAEYICTSIYNTYRQCGPQICYNVDLSNVSMDKQMLYAAGDRSTVSLVLSLGITVVALLFW